MATTGWHTAGSVIGPSWTGATVANLATLGPPYECAGFSGIVPAWLRLMTFEFVVPVGWTPIEATVDVDGQGTCGLEAPRTIELSLTKDGSTPIGDMEELILPQTTYGNVVVASSGMWGELYTREEVMAATFGVLVRKQSITSGSWVWLDRLRMKLELALDA